MSTSNVKERATYEPTIYQSGNAPDEQLVEIPDRPAAPVLLSLSSDDNSFLFFDLETTGLRIYS